MKQILYRLNSLVPPKNSKINSGSSYFHISGKLLSGLNEWYPYDVSMNIIRNSHYPRIHEDCMPNEV